MIEFTLEDDGTTDTVVECHCTICGRTWTERINMNYAATYRDDETGEMLDLDGLMDDFNIYCDCGG